MYLVGSYSYTTSKIKRHSRTKIYYYRIISVIAFEFTQTYSNIYKPYNRHNKFLQQVGLF